MPEKLVLRRSHATDHCRPSSEATATMPAGSDADDVAMLAIIDPTATVTAKSKLDILEKDRAPTSRTTATVAAQIATADTTTSHVSVHEVPSQSLITCGLPLPTALLRRLTLVGPE